ncbi:MAG: transmembrane 220 family protein [Aurantibacter sp.]
MKSFFKIFGWVFGLLCVVSAALQYNDPDPLLWIVIYGVTAIVSFAFATNKVSYSVPLVMGILFLLGSFYVFPETFEGFEIGAGDIKNIEEGREAVGLLVLSLVLFLFAWRLKRF